MSVARYPFSLTVHVKIGSQLFLDHVIHLNGEWEMCISQVCIPKCQITLFRGCLMTYNYGLQPKTPAKTERYHLWNAKLRKLSLRENNVPLESLYLLEVMTIKQLYFIEIINNTI